MSIYVCTLDQGNPSPSCCVDHNWLTSACPLTFWGSTRDSQIKLCVSEQHRYQSLPELLGCYSQLYFWAELLVNPPLDEKQLHMSVVSGASLLVRLKSCGYNSQKGSSSEEITLHLLQKFSLALMFFWIRSDFCASLLDTSPFFPKSVLLLVLSNQALHWWRHDFMAQSSEGEGGLLDCESLSLKFFIISWMVPFRCM